MSDRQQFLEELMDALEGVSAECRDDILKELEDHMVDSEELGNTRDFSAEMGTSTDLASALNAIHKPKRWENLMLAVLPGYLLSLIGLFVFTLMLPGQQSGVVLPGDASPWEAAVELIHWISVVGTAFMVFISFRRNSLELRFVWLSSAILAAVNPTILYLMDLPKALVGIGILGVMGTLLVRTLLKSRDDTLVFTFGFAHLINNLIGIGIGLLVSLQFSAVEVGLLTMIYTVFFNIASPLLLAVMFLVEARRPRWIALVGFAFLPLVMSGIWLRVPDLGYFGGIFALLLVQLAIVGQGWLSESRKFRPIAL